MVVAPLAMGGLSLIGSFFGNQQANANAEMQYKQAYRNYGIQINNLKQSAQELNREAGMVLTSAKLDGLKEQGTTTNINVERRVVGNTSRRISNNVDMQNILRTNQIKQKAESAMADIGNKMSATKLNYDNQALQISENLSNQTTSGFSMLLGAGTTYLNAGGIL